MAKDSRNLATNFVILHTTGTPHVLEFKKNFAAKKDLLKRSRFIPIKVLRDFYFKVIMPSIQYGQLFWGTCSNLDLLYVP